MVYNLVTVEIRNRNHRGSITEETPMSNAWTKKELSFLTKNYPKKNVTIAQIAAATNRTVAAVKTKAQDLGLVRPGYESRHGFKW